jgi:2-oxoglutarate ferredoxin oxidoreductase subunit beta
VLARIEPGRPTSPARSPAIETVVALSSAFARCRSPDIISPCVTFNDHEGSTKSYTWGKENEEMLHDLDFIPFFEPIEVDYQEGQTTDVELHDGSHILLKKLNRDYDPRNRRLALDLLIEAREKQQFLTGLLFVDPDEKNFIDHLNLVRSR